MGNVDPSVQTPDKNTAVGFSIVSYSSMVYNLSPFRCFIYFMPCILYLLAMQAYFVLQLLLFKASDTFNVFQVLIKMADSHRNCQHH